LILLICQVLLYIEHFYYFFVINRIAGTEHRPKEKRSRCQRNLLLVGYKPYLSGKSGHCSLTAAVAAGESAISQDEGVAGVVTIHGTALEVGGLKPVT